LVTDLNLSERICFEGWVDATKVSDYMKKAEVQLVPSRRETFGVVALEAIAAGCPVVASRTGGLPEAVGPCGILVEPNNPNALARGVRRAVKRRIPLLEKRDAHLSKFHIDTIAERYLDVFRTIGHSDDV